MQIIELGEEAGLPFLVMEYIQGSSLRDLIVSALDHKVKPPSGAAVGIIAQACAGAHVAHELKDDDGNLLGLVHRDISPHNLMVTPLGHTKLLDFGIAKATEMAELDEAPRVPRVGLGPATEGLGGRRPVPGPEQRAPQLVGRLSVLWITGERFPERRRGLRELPLT